MIPFKVQLANFFIMNGAYFTLATLVLWLACLLRFQGAELVALPFRHRKDLLLAIGGAALVFLTAHVGFRIFSDETNLLSVSENISRHMQALNSIQGYYLADGQLVSLISEVPTRPLMFPLLLAGLHKVFGVHPENAFVLNFLLLVLLLFTTAVLLKKVPLWLRVLLIFSLALNPSLAIHAATGGFDLCSLVFGLWTFVLLWRYLQTPVPGALSTLVFAAFCFVQVRYESIVILLFLFVLLLLFQGKRFFSDLKGRWLFILSPLLLLPSLIQRILTWGRFENPPGIPAFSWQHIPLHFPEVSRELFWTWWGPYPCVMDILGLLGLIFLLFRLKDKNRRWMLGFSVAYALYIVLLLLAHFMGIAESSTQIRLFMPLTIFLFFALALGLTARRAGRILVALCCVAQIGLGFRYIQQDPLLENLAMALETQELLHYLKPQDTTGILFIYRRPGQLISLGYSSVLPEFYQKHEDQIKVLLHSGLLKKVYEVISRPTENPGPLPYEPRPEWRREWKNDIPVTPRFKLQVFELKPKPAI
jgi:hypothetical protein